MSTTRIPIIILREGTKRTHGRDALHYNIQAAKVIAETVKSSFGPKGMDKMLVDSAGNVLVTNDGATILSKMEVSHPVAMYMIELAKSQDQETGDGTSSVVILAGELLRFAEELLESGIHPTIIAEGYLLAREEVTKLVDKLVIKYDNNRDLLIKVAKTAMSTKAIAENREELAEIVVNAVTTILEDGKADISNIMISKNISEDIFETKLLDGLIIEKGKETDKMPKEVKNAKILIFDGALERKKIKFDSKMKIRSVNQITELKEIEQNQLDDLVKMIVNSGANVVFTQKNINNNIATKLEKNGIVAVSDVNKEDLENLSKITGAGIQSNLKELGSSTLGRADIVEEIQIGGEQRIVIRGPSHSNVVTIIIHGGTEFVTDEYERSIHDALCVVRDVIEDNKILAGGGSVEIYIANQIREFKLRQLPIIQYVVEAFARAIESIPATLAINAGLDPIDIVGELNQKYKERKYTWGVDAHQMKIVDMALAGVYEPHRVKIHAFQSAVDTASFLLRIDDVVSAKSIGSS